MMSLRKIPFAWLLAALACGSVANAAPPQANATASALAAVERLRSRGELAEALFSSFDEATCVQSDVQLFVNREWVRINREPVDRSEFAFLATIRITPCNGVPLVIGQGWTDVVDFSIDDKVRRARLRIPSLLFADFSNSVTLTLSVDVSWDTDGRANTQRTVERFVDPDTGEVTTARYFVMFNEAVATGFVMSGSDNWIPQPSFSGSISRERLESVTRSPR